MMNPLITAHTVGLKLQMMKFQNTTQDAYVIKSFLIRMKGVPFSEKLANRCLSSCKEFDVYPEVFDGVYGKSVSKYNLDVILPRPDFKYTTGYKGNLISQIILWKKCVELNQKILILEHDALMIRKVPDHILESNFEILHLDGYKNLLYTKGKREEHLKTFHSPDNVISPIMRTSGTHSYVISPEAASKLLEIGFRDGFYNVDYHIRHCEISATRNSYFDMQVNDIFDKDSFTRDKTLLKLCDKLSVKHPSKYPQF
jgi:GR25 family glycosyltransferase involved in LPS biosynthesis